MPNKTILGIFSPTAFSAIITSFFAFIGVISVMYYWPLSPDSIPLVLFYSTLVINTYFSIRLFSSIIPEDNLLQRYWDILLVVLYINVAFSLNYIIRFEIAVLLLFIAASAKYVFLLDVIPYPKLLKRKILIDVLGTAFTAMTVAGVVFFNAYISAWIFTFLFILANILFLMVKPMYRL